MKKYIDLAKTLKEQHPALYKKLPRFVVRLIELIIMQKRMNKAINKYLGHNGVAFTDRMIEELNLKLEIEGMENLPDNGRCFFVANHLYGILDGMILGNIVGNKYGSFMGISNDAFKLIPQLESTVTSVNVYGKSAKNQLLILEEVYKSDVPINHFPAGEVSRKYNGKIEDKEWHKSFITRAITTNRDIVPVFFHGKNSRLFYAVHSLRTLLKIKANIELILLPSEMFKKKNKKIKVTIGKPIPYASLDSGLTHNEIAEKIRQYLYKLKTNPQETIHFN